MVNTLLFDLDGTLLNTNDLIIDTFKEVFKKHIPNIKINEEVIKTFIGPTLTSTFSQYVTDKNKVEELVRLYREINEEKHDKYVTIYDNVYDVIKYFHEKGFNLGIVTSKKREMAIRGLKLFGLEKYFTVVVGSSDVKNHKPNPEVLYKALSYFTNVEEVIVIGDNQSDILAAKNAHFKSIGVSWSYNIESLKESMPDYLIDNFIEIIKIVEDKQK